MLNKVIYMGRLVKDAEQTTVNEKSTVTNFTIAVDRDYVPEGEERQADFFLVVAWTLPEKFVKKYLKKGELVVVEGRNQTRKWDTGDGTNHYVTELKADHVYQTNFKAAE